MTSEKFENLVDIIERLRKECPWDKEQTNNSIKDATIEEAYEVVHAIESNNYDHLKEELGDLLLHVIFHTTIAKEENKFCLDDVIDGISEKLVRRHPHVFGETKVTNEEGVKLNWEKIKSKEGRKNILEGLPQTLPSLQLAFRIQDKISKHGYNISNAINNSFLSEVSDENQLGKALFLFVNSCYLNKINPENALRIFCKRFIEDFTMYENNNNDSKILNEKEKELVINNILTK